MNISRRTLLAAVVVTPPAAIVVDAASGRELYASGTTGLAVRPGSTLKPFTAVSLREPLELVCPGTLRVGERSLNCSHPVLGRALNLSEALAYSCNAYFVSASRGLDRAVFAGELRKFGFDVETPRTHDELALLAIGEWGVRCNVAELARGYRKLALLRDERVLRGLSAAAEYGTARLARPSGVRVAGKTGTTATHGCFAGWAPAATPRVVVAVVAPGARGGAHAAPVARELFEKWL